MKTGETIAIVGGAAVLVVGVIFYVSAKNNTDTISGYNPYNPVGGRFNPSVTVPENVSAFASAHQKIQMGKDFKQIRKNI